MFTSYTNPQKLEELSEYLQGKHNKAETVFFIDLWAKLARMVYEGHKGLKRAKPSQLTCACKGTGITKGK